MEAIKIRLTGNTNLNYTVYYRVQTVKSRWTLLAKNGELAGTEGFEYGIEAIEVLLLPHSATAPSSIRGCLSIVKRNESNSTELCSLQPESWDKGPALEKQTAVYGEFEA